MGNSSIGEDFVTYNIKEYLLDNREDRYEVIHYHPPGGQANFGLELSSSEIIFLDIIAVEEDHILLIENKASLCNSDIEKLEDLSKDTNALNKVLTYAKTHSNLISSMKTLKEIKFSFWHGFHSEVEIFPKGKIVNFLIVNKSGEVTIQESYE